MPNGGACNCGGRARPKDPPADHGAGGYKRSPGYWHRRPAMRRQSFRCPFCRTTVSDLSVERKSVLSCPLQHSPACAPAAARVGRVTRADPSQHPPLPSRPRPTLIEAYQCSTKRSHHTYLYVFTQNTIRRVCRTSFHQKTDRCCTCPKSMIVSALDYITPVCYATPPAHEISRDIL